MDLFDRFKKQDCEICGKEVGMFGYKKLEDGEICKDCVKLLSPWFEDRRHATVAQIKEQIAYRERNAKELENFTISRQIGKNEYIMYIEEVNDIPTRFFVTNRSDYKAVNPDIISFKDVVSCITDVDERHEEIKQRNSEGQMVSYRPPRYKHHYNFYIRMEIRNNPYFHEIKFRINSSDIVLETEGDVGGGIGGAVLAGILQGAGISTVGAQADTPGNFSERRRYAECATICKRSSRPWKTASAACSLWWLPLRHLFRKHPGPNSAPTAARLMRAASSASTVEASYKSLDRVM